MRRVTLVLLAVTALALAGAWWRRAHAPKVRVRVVHAPTVAGTSPVLVPTVVSYP